MTNKYVRIGALAMACILFCAGGLYLGYNTFRSPAEKPLADNNGSSDFITDSLTNNSLAAAEIRETDNIKITPGTRIVYEYIYEEDGRMETTEDEPAYFMLDKTRKEIEDTFSSWEVVKFEEEEVVLQKKVAGVSIQSYTVGTQDGYVAVFYSGPVDGSRLKEITDTPLSVLPEEDRNKLETGIQVKGEDELMRILEDYSS